MLNPNIIVSKICDFLSLQSGNFIDMRLFKYTAITHQNNKQIDWLKKVYSTVNLGLNNKKSGNKVVITQKDIEYMHKIEAEAI